MCYQTIVLLQIVYISGNKNQTGDCIHTQIVRYNESLSLSLSHEYYLLTALQEDLRRRLYGQHLVTDVIIKHLKSHMTKDPSKALTLSFHGGTGTGKNYVSKIIAESIYKEGMRSKYVHLISATKEFPHKDMVPLYKVIQDYFIESACMCNGWEE